MVTCCAEKYRDELAGRSLLFICMDKHKQISSLEVTFHGWNFMHLTGLKTGGKSLEGREGKIAAADFYNRCLARKLSPRDFEFSEDGTTHMKLDVLSTVLNRNLSAKMIGAYNSSKPRLYTEKLAGGTAACMGFVRDNITGMFVPNTVLKEDIRNHVTAPVRVIAVYRKKATDEKYAELTYQAKKADWANIKYPEIYSYIPIPGS